jgi:hypothetical protein
MMVRCTTCESVLNANENNFNNTLLGRIIKKELNESTCKRCYNFYYNQKRLEKKSLGLSKRGNETYHRKFDGATVMKNKSGIIYIVGHKNGPYKVGMTTGTIKDRVSALQTASPKEIYTYYTSSKLDSIFKVEDEILCELKPYNVRGEWFNLNIEVLKNIVETKISKSTPIDR